MIEEVRLSELIQDEIGYEAPSPSFASRGYLSHGLATRAEPHPRAHLRHERLLALVAALLAIAVVASLVWTAQALHNRQSAPVNKPRSEVGNALLPIAQAWFFSAEDGMAHLGSGPGQPPSPVLLITHDGGRTWFRPTIDASADVRWLDSQHLVALLYPGFFPYPQQLAYTADGGATWTTTNVSVAGTGGPWQSVMPHSIFFLNSDEGWATVCTGGHMPCSESQDAGQNVIYHTLDSGAHWQQLGNSFAWASVSPDELSFVDSKHGFMSTLDSDGIGRLFVTEDGGRSWRLVELPVPPGGWQGGAGKSAVTLLPSMFGEQGVLLVGRAGGDWFSYTTNDGGLTWADPSVIPVNPVKQQPQLQLVGATGLWLGALDPSNWWMLDCSPVASDATACGDGELYRTADGGRTWQRISTALPSGYILASVVPVGGDVLWGTAIRVATGFEYPVRSIDGGSTWSLIQLPTS
jgi:photosystem II stability/assembly factor-like uncharacterized protein